MASSQGAASAALLAAAALLSAGATEQCEQPTGGVIPLVISGCIANTGRCFAWMNAQCINGACQCKGDECIMQGQCVPKGSCPSLTGGHCAIEGCDRWRNATCSEKPEAQCLCGPGTCPVKGECRPPGSCAKATNGSCNVFGCHAWRKATCSVHGLVGATEEAKCMCEGDACPINGECVRPGECPRYAGSTCRLFLLTGFGPCSTGTCSSDAHCECSEGECFHHGKCVPADAASIELSRTRGEARAEAAETDGEERRRVSRALALALALVAAFATSAGVLAASRASGKGRAAGYVHLDG